MVRPFPLLFAVLTINAAPIYGMKKNSLKKEMKFECKRFNEEDTKIQFEDKDGTLYLLALFGNKETIFTKRPQENWCLDDMSIDNYIVLKMVQTVFEAKNKENATLVFKDTGWVQDENITKPLKFKCTRSIKIEHEDENGTLYTLSTLDEKLSESTKLSHEKNPKNSMSYEKYLLLSSVIDEFEKLNKKRATLIYTDENGFQEKKKSEEKTLDKKKT